MVQQRTQCTALGSSLTQTEWIQYELRMQKAFVNQQGREVSPASVKELASSTIPDKAIRGQSPAFRPFAAASRNASDLLVSPMQHGGGLISFSSAYDV